MEKLELAQSVGTLLEGAAARYGNLVAIRFIEEGQSLTYDELNQQVNRYANALRDKGIGKGDHVAVMLPNCQDYPLTWLALAKLGAVTVPLNIGYQAQDMKYVLNNSNACAIVIHVDYLPVYEQISNEVSDVKQVFLSGEQGTDQGEALSLLVEESSDDYISTGVTLDDLMNIQYTSGTTGFPKGCMLTHEYWLFFSKASAFHLNMVTGDIFLGVAPFYYLDGQWELLACITVGGTYVISKKYSASNFMKWVRDFDVTITFGTMAAWTFKQPESPLDKSHKLRLLVVGQFPANLQKPFEERFGVPVRSGYGMTETGPVTFVGIEDGHMAGSGSVGTLAIQRNVRIVDDSGLDVLTGEIGELLISGPGMMKGYYKKPEATADTLTDGWIHTGDLFRVDEDGHYYIVGRKKDMIRRSGENIAAVEVEDVLKSHSKIANAAVIAVPDESRNEEVKAYIQLSAGETPETFTPKDIIDYCKTKIAAFKVPRYIEYRNEFELTSVGKLIKGKLISDKHDLTTGCYDHEAHQ